MSANDHSVGFVTHEACLRHLTVPGHPERPERLVAIVEQLKDSGLWDSLTHTPARQADLADVALVHSRRYIQTACHEITQGRPALSTGDTAVCPDSLDAALRAVGGVMTACDAVAAGEVRRAFCAVRPPGHHATPDAGMGFCVFNNVAIAARHVQQARGAAKVLIVDWDVHHGNGTQDVFYDDASVLYFSVHRWPFYPGSGAEAESGTGDGEGLTVNAPLSVGAGDSHFRRALESRLLPAARAFGPEFVLISAGFDAHVDDPLGGMNVTPSGFGQLTQMVCGIADDCCDGRVVSVLEGGYGLAGLAQSVETHIRSLIA